MIKTDIAETSFGKISGVSNDFLFKKLKEGDDIFIKNTFELMFQFMIKNITKDSICVDIGANIGIATIYMARLARFVYSIEPQKIIYQFLNENVILNNLLNIQTYNVAAFSDNVDFDLVPTSEQDGWVGENFNIDEYNNGNYSNVYSMGSIRLKPTINGKMKGVKLDDLIDGEINFIKADAEGGDIDALIGFSKKIEKYHPIIVAEYGEESARVYNRSINDYISFANNFGYKLERLDESNLVFI